MRPTIWKIMVLVESDDADVVDAKIDAIKETLCGPEEKLGSTAELIRAHRTAVGGGIELIPSVHGHDAPPY